MNKNIVLLVILIVVVLAVAVFYYANKTEPIVVNSFDECVAAGYPVMESYPEQCKTPDGKTFVRDIGNELEKQDLIRVSSPRPNMLVQSPLTITGEARGTWFFEASFPIKLYDANGNQIGSAIAQAQSDWMTENFVPFKATLEFQIPTAKKGTLVFEKDNPSGLHENADSLIMPVYFSE
ncbi:MAG: Gmad2 immunoglobulin-like domain-containing protein [Candidatus Paceibacterota bacterium]